MIFLIFQFLPIGYQSDQAEDMSVLLLVLLYQVTFKSVGKGHLFISKHKFPLANISGSMFG